ncbi:MAG: Spermidine/putrescine import ATP-binding protein PotA [Candidatus Heimdallarchaeota archaeon LC_2]|nr:MAG: Spermidine/putrescine import ATP-binding protein PotA [Candidatus Heimdallarchaeota archaeon LC_2]
MPEIKFINVSKHYNHGKVMAIDNLNLTIKDGEYLSLLGPSGCGKTTTLRMIAGLILPTSGTILWDGKPIEHLSASDRDVGYVFQQFAIFPHLNVWDNIAFGAQVRENSSEQIEQIVEDKMSVVGLSDKANRFPANLDAADLQRIGIARVLATGARTLLLDEPMGALDHKIREKFQDELAGIVKNLDLTAIHVTHDQSEAMAISDRIGVMKKGKMIQIGSPNDLLFNPTQIFTAHFIGEADFMEGVVAKIDSHSIGIELIGDEKIVIPRDGQVRLNPTMYEKVVIGLRREFGQIINYNEEHVGKENILTGKVQSDRFLGEKRRTVVNIDFGRSIEIKRNPLEQSYSKGDKVMISIPTGNAFLFSNPPHGLENALSVT